MSHHNEPADPALIWAHVIASTPPRLKRPREVPRPESVDEVAKWDDLDGLGRTELLYAPIIWLLLPLGAIGFLGHETVTDPDGAHWTVTIGHDVVGEWQVSALPLVWIGVALWLLWAINELVVRLRRRTIIRMTNEWVFENGAAHSLHLAPYEADDGEGGSWPTFIAIDHRTTDEQAARLHQALRTWVSERATRDALAFGSLHKRSAISTTELFGADASGGYFLGSIPVSGTAADVAAQEWVLITKSPEGTVDAEVTPVPRERQLLAIRRKLRRRRGNRGRDQRRARSGPDPDQY